jgi:hypothetical protein
MKMRSLRAAVAILCTAAAFILPAAATIGGSQLAPLAASTATPDDTPWH